MIAVFLSGELESSRYGATLRAAMERDGVAERLLAAPDLADGDANAYRRRLLDEHRSYERREGLFFGFPQRVEWFRARASADEVLEILYINWSWWLKVSGGTRRPRDGAARIRRGEIEGATPEQEEELLEAIDKPLIAATTPSREKLVLVEGHGRLTAYALFPERLPPELELLIGVSEDMPRWCQW